MANSVPRQNGSGAQQQVPWIAFVLCREQHARVTVEPSVVVKRFIGDAYSAEVGDEDGTALISCGEDFFGFLGPMPASIPNQEAQRAAEGNFTWPNAPYEVAQHQSHVIVALQNADRYPPTKAALLLTRLTLMALTVYNGFAVYWPEAYLCHSRQFFEDLASQASDQHLPVPLWIRCYLGRNRTGSLAGFTWGMHQFGLMDFEVERCNLGPAELIELLWDLAHYLLVNGPIIGDGDTVGPTEEIRILVRYGMSRSNPPRQVYKLLF